MVNLNNYSVFNTFWPENIDDLSVYYGKNTKNEESDVKNDKKAPNSNEKVLEGKIYE